jgi:membrane associated rhomboid family serine protease
MRGSRTPSPLADWVLECPISWLFAALNLGIFVIIWSRGGRNGEGLSNEALLAFGALERYHIWYGDEYWRLLTAVFLHVTWTHLLWNLIGIFPRCADVERTVGSLWFAFAYVTTGVGASAVSVLCHPVFGAGASGAGFGMISVTLAILYRREGSWDRFMSNPHVRQVLGWTLIWVVIGLTMMRGLDHFAHLGGFAFGIPCGLLLETRRGRHRGRWIAGLAAYIFVLLGVVVAACVPELGIGQRGE